MRDELLAYLLNDLDDEQRRRIEERLEVDPIWQHELNRLRSYVDEARQSEPSESDELPEDLVSRTCSFVKQASSQGALSPAVLPAKLSESQEAVASRMSRWTRLDMVVVASILIVLGTLLVPAIRESREAARRVQCQEKLRALSAAMAQYAEQNQGQLPAIGRHENAGMYAVKLREAGILSEQQLISLIVCPSSQLADDVHRRVIVLKIPSQVQLQKAPDGKLQLLYRTMGGDFAYHIGHVDRHNVYRQPTFVGSSHTPMMADKPSRQVVGFQSSHHQGCGQNVAFHDQSVRFVSLCEQNDRDNHWFLNADGRPAAGKHRADVVMMSSELRPFDLFATPEDESRVLTNGR